MRAALNHRRRRYSETFCPDVTFGIFLGIVSRKRHIRPLSTRALGISRRSQLARTRSGIDRVRGARCVAILWRITPSARIRFNRVVHFRREIK